jgi:prevent-host-death family protein
MAREVNIHEAKTQLSRLVAAAEAGEEVVIARAGRPVAKLVPFSQGSGPRPLGGWRGRVTIHDAFDAPLPPEIARGFGLDSE